MTTLTIDDLIIRSEQDNNYFIVIFCNKQYAEGITGSNHYVYIIAGDNIKGFKYIKDAKIYFSTIRTEYKSITTQKDRGYGALGNFYTKPKYIKCKDLKDAVAGGNGLYFTKIVK